MKTEFNIGDTVTYKPYEKAFDVQITGIKTKDTDLYMKMNNDDRIFYCFKLKGANIESSGLCIKESDIFEPYIEGE